MDTEHCETITVDELRSILGIGRDTAYKAVRNGQIPSIKIGNRFLIPKRRLEKLLEGGALSKSGDKK